MGLTSGSTGIKAVDTGLIVKKQHEEDLVIALAGNPNVGKSTVFNELTGMNQHTGNWPGKTVSNAQGYATYGGKNFVLVDIPGSYSLMAHSAEEEVARDFICFGKPDGVVVVCDATCLERNLNLALQTIEITDHVVVCVNLMDEARRKGIQIDLEAISQELGVPVIPAEARSGKGLDQLMQALCTLKTAEKKPIRIRYVAQVEKALAILEPVLSAQALGGLRPRWLALRLLDEDATLLKALADYLKRDITKEKAVAAALAQAREALRDGGLTRETLRDRITASLVLTAEGVCADAVRYERQEYLLSDRRLDRILTSKWTGFPIMLALLAVVFWLTITGANYPSQMLSAFFFWVQARLTDFFMAAGAPGWVNGLLVEGVYRTLAWVIITYRDAKRTCHKAALYKPPCYKNVIIFYINPLNEGVEQCALFFQSSGLQYVSRRPD